MKALIVDDSAVMRQVIKNGLAPINFDTILEAENGRVGVDLFKKEKPDFITMDIHMPVMDGLEAIKHICAEDENAKILVISTISETKAIRKALLRGAAYYIIKPFKADQIVQLTKDVLFSKKHIRDEFKKLVDNLKQKHKGRTETDDNQTYLLNQDTNIAVQKLLDIKSHLKDLNNIITDIFNTDDIDYKTELLETTIHILTFAEETSFDSIKIGTKNLNLLAKDLLKNVRQLNDELLESLSIYINNLYETIDYIIQNGKEDGNLFEKIVDFSM